MTVSELMQKLRGMHERGLGDLDVNILLHNTTHDIDQMLVATNTGNVEDGIGAMATDAQFVYLTKVIRPSRFLEHGKYWKKVNE